jgi:hypothetical protein
MKHAHAGMNHYVHLLLMTALSFVSMYVLMYAMVDRLANIYGTYTNKRLNVGIMIASIVVGLLFFIGIRQQTAIGDNQFLKSMIPHHASALLMCNEAPIADTEIQELCKTIVAGQQAEIDQMKAMLARLAQK